MDLNWEQLVEERNAWVAHNFPDNKAPLPVETTLGVIEELGELAHAHLKQLQSIRGTDDQHVANGKDAIGDLIVYLLGVMSYADVRPYATVPHHRNPEVLLLQLAHEVGRLSMHAAAGARATRSTFQADVDRIVGLATQYCRVRRWDFERIVSETWANVKRRDWIKYPHTGLPPLLDTRPPAFS